MSNITEKAKVSRPWIIVVLCIGGAIYRIPLLLVIMASLLARELTVKGQVDLLVFILIFTLEIFGLLGYWKMRKWGIYLYGLGSIAGIMYGYSSNWHPEIYQYAILAIFIGAGLIYYKRMR